MNRAYRIVWSEARQAFVVTHEKAKANGKPSSTRKAVASAVVMALAALAATPALALPPPSSCVGGGAISISAAETVNCSLTSGSSLIVTNTGSIDVSASFANDAIFASGGSIGSITNDGAISGGGFNGDGIALYSSTSITGSITNSGTISGGSNNGGGISLSSSSITGSITNSGTISGGGGGIAFSNGSSVGSITNDVGGIISVSGTGIALYSSSIGGSLTNSGTISVSYAGIAVYSSGSIGGGITNSGTISASGTAGNAGRGIIISSGGSITGSLSNSGTISGANVGVDIVGGSSSIGGGITNNGTISGSWAGIRITSGGSVGSITNSGMISASSSSAAAINLGNSSIGGSITNSGTISGGSGIYLHSSGSITGSIINSGTISGSWSGITLYMSSIGGSITNSDTISASGASGRGIDLFSGSIGGSITNSGTISGGSAGIRIRSSSSIGGITNSGTISGGTNAILVDGSSTLANIDIAGNDTASFVGSVLAGNTAMSIISGATYTLKTADAFTVASFTNNGTALFGTGANSFDLTNVTGNTFANNGTLGVAAGGTGTITGNYTQAAAGTFRTNVTNDTTYGKLVVTGTATLPTNAKIDVNVANPNFAFTATGMAGVITAGTLTWDGTSVVTDNSVLFDFTASKNGNAVDLALAAAAPTGGGGGGTVVASVTSTGNISATGAATVLDTLATAFAGGGTGDADMDTVIGALGGLTTNQQVSDAVGQTLPLMTGGMTQATSSNLSGVNHVVQAHQDSNTGLSSGDGFVTDGKVWLKPLGSWADQKDANGVFGYSAQTYGMVLGADGELSQDSTLGAAFAYTRSSVAGNSGAQTAAVDSYQAVLYGSRSLDQSTEFNWQADYGYNQNKGSRYIAFMNRIAAANYNSDSLHVGAGIGRTMPVSGNTSFTPSFRADYTGISDRGYTETGAGALNLVVNGKTTEEFILALDGKVVHKLNDNASVAGNLGVGYDVNARQNSITASFAGGGAAFTTSGIKPSSTLVRGGLGYVSTTGSGVEITARYDIEARTGFTAQTASVKARMPF